jgi:predicted ATPase/class 3 adenylate cyclase
VTFLFTDLKASTRMWEEHTDAMHDALARHDQLLRDAIESHHGYVVKTMGDAFHGAFGHASDALEAAVAMQRALGDEHWGETGALSVRVGLHTGESEMRDGDYYGPAVNRASRIKDVANSGQTLMSRATRDLVSDLLRDGVTLVDLGEHRLRDLTRPEQLFEVHAPGLATQFPPLRAARASLGNLPVEQDAFVGRGRELGDLVAAMRDASLVTLVGAGGVGKTRLAVRAGREVSATFDSGAWLVELQGVGNEEQLDEAVAGALGVEQRRGLTLRESVLESLRDKELLLILDNCEHLVGAAAELVEAALARGPRVHVVATSREGLGIRGEHVFTVPVMGLPDRDASTAALRDADAVRLFVTRASEVTGEQTPPDDHLADIATLCRRLDGLPLAIELAAARRRSMTPAEIAEHLDRRFRMLTGGRRTAVSRHQTMRNAVDWSYDLLDEDERRMLERAAVFAGDFDRRAAGAVAAGSGLDPLDVVDVLGHLVDKSLVIAESHGAHTRYRPFETIRDYAWERLAETGDADSASRLHAEHFVTFAADAGAGLRGRDEVAWTERVDEELDNLQAALRWALAVDDADVALRLVGPMVASSSAAGMPFGAMAEDAADMPGAASHALRPAVLAAAAFSARVADPEHALELAERACAVASAPDDGDPERRFARGLALASRAAVLAVNLQPGREEAAAEFLESARDLDDDYLLCEALNLCAASVASDAELLALDEDALAVARRLGNPSRIAFSLLIYAVPVSRTDTGRARALLAEAAELAASVHQAYAADFALTTLAQIQCAEDDVDGAVATLSEAFERADWSGDRASVTHILLMLARILVTQGADDEALVLLDRYGIDVEELAAPFTGDPFDVVLSNVRARATPAQREEAHRRAAGLDPRDLVELAVARLQPVPS